jgi:hypothetical protein
LYSDSEEIKRDALPIHPQSTASGSSQRQNALPDLRAALPADWRPEKAVRLLGASEALLGTMGLVLQAGEQFEIERYVRAVREQLDETTFQAARAEGHAMSAEKAVAYALATELD